MTHIARFIWARFPSKLAFVIDERGNIAIEYGLLAAGISVLIITLVFDMGATLRTAYFDEIATALKP